MHLTVGAFQRILYLKNIHNCWDLKYENFTADIYARVLPSRVDQIKVF